MNILPKNPFTLAKDLAKDAYDKYATKVRENLAKSKRRGQIKRNIKNNVGVTEKKERERRKKEAARPKKGERTDAPIKDAIRDPSTAINDIRESGRIREQRRRARLAQRAETAKHEATIREHSTVRKIRSGMGTGFIRIPGIVGKLLAIVVTILLLLMLNVVNTIFRIQDFILSNFPLLNNYLDRFISTQSPYIGAVVRHEMIIMSICLVLLSFLLVFIIIKKTSGMDLATGFIKKTIAFLLIWGTILNIVVTALIISPFAVAESVGESASSITSNFENIATSFQCNIEILQGGQYSDKCNQYLNREDSDVSRLQQVRVEGLRTQISSFDYDFQNPDNNKFIARYEIQTDNVPVQLTGFECFATLTTDFESTGDIFVENLFDVSLDDALTLDDAEETAQEDERVPAKRTSFYSQDLSDERSIVGDDERALECDLNQLIGATNIFNERDTFFMKIETALYYTIDARYSITIPHVMCDEIYSNPAFDERNSYSSCNRIPLSTIRGAVDNPSLLDIRTDGSELISLDTNEINRRLIMYSGDESEPQSVSGRLIFRETETFSTTSQTKFEALEITEVSLPNILEFQGGNTIVGTYSIVDSPFGSTRQAEVPISLEKANVLIENPAGAVVLEQVINIDVEFGLASVREQQPIQVVRNREFLD